MSSLAAVTEAIGEYGPRRAIIWAGSGVSCLPPTNLPLGGPLTNFAVEATCGPEFLAFVRRVWERVNRTLGGSLGQAGLGGYPRLESILEAIADCEAALVSQDQAFLSGFQSFADAPYNENHSLLAGFLSLGGSIVTTNFDTCIEDACLDVKVHLNPSMIRHIHGSIGANEELGLTISRVKEGLSRQFAKWLTKRLRSGVCLVFLGYSASDFLDVNVYFSQLDPNDVMMSTAVFVQHGSTPIPRSARRMLSAFQKRLFVHADTTRFLRRCFGESGIRATRKAPHSSFKWNERFLSLVGSSTRKMSPILTVRICNLLGVSAFTFDGGIARRCHRLKRSMEPEFYHETMALLQRTAGNDRGHMYHELRRATAPDAQSLLSYYLTTRRLRDAARIAWPTSTIIKNARSGKETESWFLLGSIKVHVRRVIVNVLTGAGLSNDTVAECRELLAVTEGWSARKYRDVADLKETANSMRLNLLLRAIVRRRLEARLRRETVRIYRELSCVDGIAHSLRDFAVCDMIRAVYQDTGKTLVHAAQALAEAHEICRVTGDAIELERIAYLRQLHRRVARRVGL